MDHRPAAELPSRRSLSVRRADARHHHGARDCAGGALDAQFAHRAGDLRDGWQSRGCAPLWGQPTAHRAHGVRAAWVLRWPGFARLCDAAPRDPVDDAARSRAHYHHRCGRWRRQHSRRRLHGRWLDIGRHPHRRDHERARVHQRFALLDGRVTRRSHSRNRHRRHLAPPAPRRAGVEAMSLAIETKTFRVPRWLKRHETLLAMILLIALVGLGLLNDRFLTLDNLLNQGRLMTEIGLIALPMTFVIITGGIDLSVGALAGFINGLVITRVKVPPLIMTIATLALYRGLAEGISQAHSVRGYPEWFYFLGQGDVFGVPTQLLLLLVLIVIAGIVLDRTTFGRALYAIGANETAARFSALSVDRVKLIVYTLSGFASGLAAWVLVSRVTTTRMDMGS